MKVQSSSILEPKLHLEIHPDVEFSDKEVIQVEQLDKFKIHNSDFLNIDVQGYELNVLKGKRNTFKDKVHSTRNKQGRSLQRCSIS